MSRWRSVWASRTPSSARVGALTWAPAPLPTKTAKRERSLPPKTGVSMVELDVPARDDTGARRGARRLMPARRPLTRRIAEVSALLRSTGGNVRPTQRGSACGAGNRLALTDMASTAATVESGQLGDRQNDLRPYSGSA